MQTVAKDLFMLTEDGRCSYCMTVWRSWHSQKCSNKNTEVAHQLGAEGAWI